MSDEDRLNALYVAFTRAKRSLFICAKKENSTFEMLNLTPLERGMLTLSKNESIVAQNEMALFMPQRYGSQEVSKIEEETSEADVSSMTFGIAQHYLLEMWDGFEEQTLGRAYLAVCNRFAPLLDETALHALYQRAEHLLTCKEFLALLKGAKIYKEQPLMYQKERKQIDLLLEHPDKIVVIDYKSSKRHSTKHHAQVKLYQEALSQMYALPVEGYICYLAQEGVELVKSL